MMECLLLLIKNNVFISVVLAWFVSQAIKSGVYLAKEGKVSWRLVFECGGMPSSHSATVSGLTAAVFIVEGVGSLSVAVLVFSIIVMRDLIGLHLNIKKPTKIGLDRAAKHNPIEIIVGIIIGVAAAVLVAGII